MTADIALITAIYDKYDSLKPVLPQHGTDVDWVCVTDDPDLQPEGWRIVYRPLPDIHPNRAAKWPKLHPEMYTAAPASIWIDASFRVTSPNFATEAIAYADPIAQFIHPWRDCIYPETEASVGLPKYAGEPVTEQAKAYRQQGHPEHWGLWATGVIARRHGEALRRLGTRWMQEIADWSFQDQISEPHALRLTDLRPAALPGTHFANDWLSHEGSGRH